MTTKAQRVRTELLRRIGELGPHAALPREIDLAAELGVSRSTLRQVLAPLVRSGVLYTVPGTGTFVGDDRIAKGASISGFSEDMRARGMVPGSRLLAAAPVVASGSLAVELAVAEGDVVYRIDRLRLADGTPMCVESVFLPTAPFPGLLGEDLTGGLYDLLKAKYGVEVATTRQTVSAVSAQPDEAELLAVDPGAPLLEVVHVGSDARGRVIERGVSRYRADRYRFVSFGRREAAP